MKFAAGVLILLLPPPGVPAPRAASPILPSPVAVVGASQEWLADPILPAVFRFEAGEGEDGGMPPLSALPVPARQDPPGLPPAENRESAFPPGIRFRDIQAWRDEDDLRRIREWAGDTAFKIPLLVPQLILEAVLPRGLAVGPTTFLYKTSSAPPSLALVVFDQALFHEAQFLAQAQAYASDTFYAEDLRRGQRRVLRQSLMNGFRATYAMPRLTMDLIVQTAEEQGAWGYVLAPPVAGALLFMKGIDQKLQLDDDFRIRFRLASGQQWQRGIHSDAGNPALSLEIRFCDLPIGIVSTFDISNRGMTPAFIGLGTALDVVEELLGREAATSLPPQAR